MILGLVELIFFFFWWCSFSFLFGFIMGFCWEVGEMLGWRYFLYFLVCRLGGSVWGLGVVLESFGKLGILFFFVYIWVFL